jgi:hypothetical protein
MAKNEVPPDDELDEASSNVVLDELGKQRGARPPVGLLSDSKISEFWDELVKKASAKERVDSMSEGVRIAWARAAHKRLKSKAKKKQAAILDSQLADIERFLGFPS